MNSEILNLNEDMVLDLIRKVEQSIFDITRQMDGKTPNLKAAEEMYLPLREEMDTFFADLSKEKQTLAVLIGFKENKNDRKSIRVLKSVTNSTPKKRKDRFSYTEAAIKVLEKAQIFLSPDNLVYQVFDQNSELKLLFQNGQEKAAKQKVKSNYNTNATGLSGTKNPKILLYNGKYGLREWFDVAGTPLSKFLSSFMRQEAVTHD